MVRKLILAALISFTVGILATPKQAHAIDRKVMLMFKTAGYGAAAGLLVGAATYAMGVTKSKSLFMGPSLGLYGGIILGAYILATYEDPAERRRHENPWKPSTPVGPDDWEREPSDTLGPIDNTQIELMTPPNLSAKNTFAQPLPQIAVWQPVISVSF